MRFESTEQNNFAITASKVMLPIIRIAEIARLLSLEEV
jgi:hypothetical protein